MKKYFGILLFLFLSINLVFSQEIDTLKAKEYALFFIKKHDKTQNYKISEFYSMNYNNHKSIYIITFRPTGFVIISAFKFYEPILAYSTQNSLYLKELFPEVEILLKQYDLIIDYLYNNIPENNYFLKEWSELEKDENSKIDIFILTESRWGQSRNNNNFCGNFEDTTYGAYNKYIPSYNSNCFCDKCSAGCTAIALAQILYYWKYPTYSEKRIYEWENIPDFLSLWSRKEEIDATAYLIADCADFIDSKYCKSDCGTNSTLLKARNSLVKDFNYSKKADFRKRTVTDKWKNRILDDLENGLPVLYGAASNFSGNDAHAFVCDGYDYDNDLFHFNFGWRGNGNGFYNIDDFEVIMNNDTINFDIWHWAVFNIYPEVMYECNSVVDLGGWYSENDEYIPMIDQPWAGTVLSADNSYPENYRTVYDGDVVNMHAYNSIVLRQGFSVRQGGNFHAYLTDCPNLKNYTNNQNQQNQDTVKSGMQNNLQKLEFLNLQFEIFPNPVTSTVSISYYLPQTTELTVEIFDIYGQKIKEIENTEKEKGNYQYYINLSLLQNGVYFCTLKTQFGLVSQKIVKM